jgi:hypothetical protein
VGVRVSSFDPGVTRSRVANSEARADTCLRARSSLKIPFAGPRWRLAHFGDHARGVALRWRPGKA